ncbi:MAG TPA: AmmeMemoRadiSam system protein A [Pyrinomonadaceae bacterium]|jgi:AmmeMemoRadiSam system protein A/AmmeMemoRadiSam system protein B|nr:AmmeMemoRadiSam system protein A [Pyrinomonadaceae bacterium]
MSTGSLVYVGFAPHPPIMVPEVGRDSAREVAGSIEAMRVLSERVVASGAQTLVIISPHAPLEARAFIAYRDPELRGGFAPFRAPQATVSAPLDAELLDAISRAATEDGFAIAPLEGYELDHGTAVPLYFLLRNGWRGSLVALGYSFLPDEEHLRFGASLRRAADALGRPVAFVASGDLSHRLTRDAPAGYQPDAHLFDEQVVASLHDGEPRRVAGIDQGLRRLAGECGYRSLLVAVGAADGLRADCEVLHYEAPFGVGYLVAQLARGGAAEDENLKRDHPHSETNDRTEVDEKTADQSPPERRTDGMRVSDQFSRGQTSDQASSARSVARVSEESGAELPALARRAVESYVLGGRAPGADDALDAPLLDQPAACFVSIKTDDGELRGCIGTVEPMRPNLAEELIANAVSAATRDPRFPPVSAEELPRLRYSVDVLSEPEPAQFEDLDPKDYGVIVEDEAGTRRGLLLPDIEGVETAAQQVQIAARKAGISPRETVRLYRFRVRRFSESSSSNELTK